MNIFFLSKDMETSSLESDRWSDIYIVLIIISYMRGKENHAFFFTAA